MAKIKHHVKNRTEKPYGLDPSVFEFTAEPCDKDYEKYMALIGKRSKKQSDFRKSYERQSAELDAAAKPST